MCITYDVPIAFAQEARKFLTQHANFTLEARRSKEFHDRFVILDDNECWHIGCSIKDAGNGAFMLSVSQPGSGLHGLLLKAPG